MKLTVLSVVLSVVALANSAPALNANIPLGSQQQNNMRNDYHSANGLNRNNNQAQQGGRQTRFGELDVIFDPNMIRYCNR